MLNRQMTICALICVVLLAAAAFAAKAPAKAKIAKAPATQSNSATTADKTTSSTTPLENQNPAVEPNSNGPRAGEEINWDVIAAGGGAMSSANFVLNGTLGQTVAGESSSPGFALNAGFWQNFGSGYLCGDVNQSGFVDIADVVYFVNYIFAAGPAPMPIESADANCTASIDISDVVYLVNYIFGSGAVPCAACS